MEFSRQEYQSGLPCPPGDLSDSEIKPTSLKSHGLAGRFFTTNATWKVQLFIWSIQAVVVQLLSCIQLLQPYGLQPAGLLCPWHFPGKNTGVGYHFLLQGITDWPSIFKLQHYSLGDDKTEVLCWIMVSFLQLWGTFAGFLAQSQDEDTFNIPFRINLLIVDNSIGL